MAKAKNNQSIGGKSENKSEVNYYCRAPVALCIYELQLVLRHQKFHQYISQSFVKISTLKFKSYRNVATIFKISAEIVILKFGQK